VLRCAALYALTAHEFLRESPKWGTPYT
jgi:hypothetical protein